MIRAILFAIFVFLVATFPATWLLMLFFGNLGHPLGYWGVLPLRDHRVDAVERIKLPGPYGHKVRWPKFGSGTALARHGPVLAPGRFRSAGPWPGRHR